MQTKCSQSQAEAEELRKQNALLVAKVEKALAVMKDCVEKDELEQPQDGSAEISSEDKRKEEYLDKLQAIFDSTPVFKSMNKTILKIWRKQPKFNVRKVIKSRNIPLNFDLPILQNRNFDTSQYSGQFDVRTNRELGFSHKIYDKQMQEKFVFPDNTKYERTIFHDEEIYEGYYSSDGQMNGEGKLTKRSGTVHQGLWQNGDLIKKT